MVEEQRAFEVDLVVVAEGGGGEAVVVAGGVRDDLEGVRGHRGDGADADAAAARVEQQFDGRRAAEFGKRLCVHVKSAAVAQRNAGPFLGSPAVLLTGKCVPFFEVRVDQLSHRCNTIARLRRDVKRLF